MFEMTRTTNVTPFSVILASNKLSLTQIGNVFAVVRSWVKIQG